MFSGCRHAEVIDLPQSQCRPKNLAELSHLLCSMELHQFSGNRTLLAGHKCPDVSCTESQPVDHVWLVSARPPHDTEHLPDRVPTQVVILFPIRKTGR